MVTKPIEQELGETLSEAGLAHHDYESNFLGGVRDDRWSGWYSAYVLGRHGEFTTPSCLTRWLEEVPGDGDWPKIAAAHIISNLVSL